MTQAASMKEILLARECRAARQQALLTQWGQPLICFTMNIAGPVKVSWLIEQGFQLGISCLEAQLHGSGIPVLHQERSVSAAGFEAFYVLQAPPQQLKTLCVQIEDRDPLGRLFDMDVLAPDGKKLQRTCLGLAERTCLLCGNPAYVCSRSRQHSLQELQSRTTQLLTDALNQEDCRHIANTAVKSLLYEVAVAPKPGLVDRNGPGSHQDMDLFTFLGSASTLWPYFQQCVETGQRFSGQPPQAVLSQLRYPGKLAEQAMLLETGGVNTHKGAIFSLGLLCAAAGYLGPRNRTPEGVLDLCAAMAEGLTQRELGQASTTAGERLYQKFGITGIRGQTQAGFPAVRNTGLPVLRQGLSQGLSLNDAAAAALLHIITATEDTNLLSRGGPAAQQWAVQQTHGLLCRNPFPTRAQISELRDAFVQRNLSPGGSADLLSLTLFLHFL